jgi:tetratricopeptide (TPR) repeat protein
MRAAATALVALLLGGCVYYNAMYNTKRLAGSARKAEREGRTLEANNLWGQVVTRAETLVVRHPDSKYVDEATVLKGIALARLGECPDALRPLARGSVIEDADTREEAALALGRCQIELGDPDAASLAFAEVLKTEDPVRHREARLQQARALRRVGRPQEALASLEGLTGRRVSEERLLALGSSGREAETLALADSLLAASDSVQAWDSVLAAVGRSDPRTASALVDRLDSRPNMSMDVRARRLYQDAVRLEDVDSTRSMARYREAARAGPSTDFGGRARLRLLKRQLAASVAPDDLAPLADSLRLLATSAGVLAPEANALLGTAARVRAAADSTLPGAPQGDLRLFLAAEAARDSLLAPTLAVGLFRRVVDDWPDSPYAPKALLAGGVLDPGWAEAMRPVLEERYADSPYLALLRGEEPVGYRALEDSLQAYAQAVAAARRPPAQPGVRRPGVRTPQRPQPVPRRGLDP